MARKAIGLNAYKDETSLDFVLAICFGRGGWIGWRSWPVPSILGRGGIELLWSW